MNKAQKKRFYLIFAALVVLSLAAGLAVGYRDRSATICKDGKPPVAENDQGPLENVLFKCANGQIVTTG